ncbi:MAG: hypothetical protein K8T91_19140 [Planctomycetes bacterium]|nr:hypothetical protein [Planctomycetota bacterium]
MRTPGERIKRTRLIQTERYVVAVDVEMVIPPDDPREPCSQAETVQYLKGVKEHAEQVDLAWLSERGKVYAAVTPA